MTTEHPRLAAALAAFQAELPTIAKANTASVKSERTGKEFSYKYADLADISPVVLSLLGKHGLAFTAKPTLNPAGEFVLAYRLLHTSGDSEDGEYPLPAATTPPQQLGSAITYARRYALCAVTGVAPGGDDDDAASAPPASATRRRTNAATEAPEPTVADLQGKIARHLHGKTKAEIQEAVAEATGEYPGEYTVAGLSAFLVDLEAGRVASEQEVSV